MQRPRCRTLDRCRQLTDESSYDNDPPRDLGLRPAREGLHEELGSSRRHITGVAGDLDPSIWGKRAKSQRLAICSPSFAAQRSGLLANPYGFPL